MDWVCLLGSPQATCRSARQDPNLSKAFLGQSGTSQSERGEGRRYVCRAARKAAQGGETSLAWRVARPQPLREELTCLRLGDRRIKQKSSARMEAVALHARSGLVLDGLTFAVRINHAPIRWAGF